MIRRGLILLAMFVSTSSIVQVAMAEPQVALLDYQAEGMQVYTLADKLDFKYKSIALIWDNGGQKFDQVFDRVVAQAKAEGADALILISVSSNGSSTFTTGTFPQYLFQAIKKLN